MRLKLPLTPQEEAKLIAKAQSEGTTLEGLVKEAIQPILNSVPECLPHGEQAGIERAAAFRAWAKRRTQTKDYTPFSPRARMAMCPAQSPE